MGTRARPLGSVGGFILGSEILVKYLKHCAGGFVFSVGLAPACASAALKSVELMTKAPTRTLMLQERSKYFYDLCKKNMIPMGENTFRVSSFRATTASRAVLARNDDAVSVGMGYSAKRLTKRALLGVPPLTPKSSPPAFPPARREEKERRRW
ncbi:unnamed protein product [Peronospora belbahrii]|uniref:Aminotransferase class I/classII large domain-containing protein n=1 Tax=Peronospora belbahrii TaxID=622444 RepID=A0ABN8CTI0_9STRA|nr:unnamed protein product [Peronospora belbahrii]